MKNFSRLIIAVIVLTLIACGGSGSTAKLPPGFTSSCDSLKGDDQVTCLQEKEAELTLAFSREVAKTERTKDESTSEVRHVNVPPPTPTPSDAMPVENRLARNQFGMLYVPMDANGECGLDTYNFQVRNTKRRFLEVRGETHKGLPALVPCGDGHVIARVQQGNGQPRWAFVIPPKSAANYVFLPWNGGHGNQNYWVDAYAATAVSVLDPLRPDMAAALLPAKHDGTYANQTRTPFDGKWGWTTISDSTRFGR